MRAVILLSVFVVAAGGCASADKPGGEAADGADGTDGSDGSDVGPVTYYADVQPVLQQHCVRCHTADGLGPGDFTDPTIVEALAPAMLAAIDDGRMPPPVSDPDCRDYEGSEFLSLPAESRAIFAAWVDQDQPMGDPSEAVEVPPVETDLVAPDFVLEMPEAYAPTFSDPGNPGNEYRCFAIDPGESAGKYITAMAPVLGEPALVHHVVLFSVPKDGFETEYLDPQGFDCIDGMGGDSTDGMLAAWAPGMLPLTMPDGVGIEIPDDAYLVMQMHYFANGTAGGELVDQSGYAFDLTDVAQPALVAPLGSYGFAIPAGDGDYTFSGDFRNTYIDLTLLGTFPHMHQLGKSYDLRVTHEDGSETCLATGDYDFNNQLTYQWSEPVDFDLGDRMEWSCSWDNSQGDETVRFGERTDEEMCYFFTLVTF